MFYLNFKISNPFAKDTSGDIFHKMYLVTKNKLVEFNIVKDNAFVVISCSISYKTRCTDLTTSVGLFGYTFTFQLIDSLALRSET